MMERPDISPRAAAMLRLGSAHTLGLNAVNDLKDEFARLITRLEGMMRDNPDAAREAAIAITHVQTAAFFAVFALTAPPPVGALLKEDDTLDS